MSDKIIYVIGNGFDLWHGLPTSYRSFYNYAKDDLDEFSQYGYIDESEWSKFEESLGKYDWGLLYDAYNEIDATHDSFRPSEFFGLEDELKQETERIVDSIKMKFSEWVNEINEVTMVKKMKFIDNSNYLSFNYTNTLERGYGISGETINYIHGSASNMDELIIGHGLTILDDPEIDENGESNRTMASDAEGAAKYPLYAFKKPVAEILTRHEFYFESLNNHTIVAVIGHSLNDIDLPYFSKILSINNRAKWIVTYHDHNEKDVLISQLVKIGVDPMRVVMCKVNDVEGIVSRLINNNKCAQQVDSAEAATND